MRVWGWAIIVILFAGLQYTLWMGQGGLLEQAELRHQVNEQQAAIDLLESENAALRVEVQALLTDEGLEEAARARLGVNAPDEILIRVIPSTQ